jgi:hypothetical protein
MAVILSTPSARLAVANNGQCLTKQLATELNAVLLAAGWTLMNSAQIDFANLDEYSGSSTDKSVFTDSIGPAYPLPVYKMNDALASTTSPWYMAIDVRTGSTNSAHIRLMVQTGTGYDDVTYLITGAGTNVGNPIATNSTSASQTTWYVNAYESGFTFYISNNGADDIADNLINVERGRSFTGVLEDTIITTGGLTATATTATWTGLVIYAGSVRTKCMSLVRDWTLGEYPQGASPNNTNYVLMLQPIYWQNTVNTTVQTYLQTYSYNTPGNTSGLAIGPFPYGGGPHGMPRLFYFGAYPNISSGTVINTTQDGQTRRFYNVVPSSVTFASYPNMCKVMLAVE